MNRPAGGNVWAKGILCSKHVSKCITICSAKRIQLLIFLCHSDFFASVNLGHLSFTDYKSRNTHRRSIFWARKNRQRNYGTTSSRKNSEQAFLCRMCYIWYRFLIKYWSDLTISSILIRLSTGQYILMSLIELDAETDLSWSMVI